MLRLIFAAFALAWGFAAQAHAAEPWQDWQAPIRADSPMAGTVWDARAGAEIGPSEMIARLARARFVLIGEVHDNPDHHRLQAWIVARLAQADMSPTVVMEMIPRDKADTLAAYLARPDATAEGLGPALDWNGSGWPDWRFYQPVAEAALNAGLTIAPGNPPRELERETAQEGFQSFGAARMAELGLDEPLLPALTEALAEELYDAHCELLPRERLAPMARIQRLRDAFMADGLLGADTRSAVLIAGNGHVRADRGVPWYLRQRAPDAGVAVVMLAEVDETGKSPGDHVETGPDGDPAADFVWLTPRAERPDPCEQMRRQFRERGRSAD